MISKAFVINMPSSYERLNAISSQFKKLNFTFEIVPGVDLKLEPHLKDFYSVQDNIKNFYYPLSDGEIGCFLAHRNVWKRIVENEINYGLVLEDDALVSDDLKNVLEVIDNLKIDWHIIKLTETNLKPRRTKNLFNIDGYDLVSYYKPPASTCAYVISRSGAELLLSLSIKISRPIDIEKQWYVFKGLKIFGLKPYTVSQNFKFVSEIDRIKSRKEITSSLKIKRNIKRILLSLEYRLKKFLYDLKNNI